MKVLVTGANGFVGKNLCLALINAGHTVYKYTRESNTNDLENYCKDCEFAFNLAGVNRPKDPKEFVDGNYTFAKLLLDTLKKYNNKCPVMYASSTQALLDNDYGKSKKLAEDLLFKYGKENSVNVFVYRFANLFGKWCKPNYNSVVATFCDNIANDLPVRIDNLSTELNLCYIDDVIDELLHRLNSKDIKIDNILDVHPIYKVTLQEIVDLLNKFKEQPKTLVVPEIPDNSFAKKLYSTYLSYLPKDKIAFDLKVNSDERGSFTELIKTISGGQFSVNVAKPGITKGQHWHNSKWEFFIVVSGHGQIQERKIGTNEVITFEVYGDKPKAIHMLPGYTHSITNLDKEKDLVTVMWVNEGFNKDKPDTIFEKV